MASTGREILGEHYGADHITHEQIEELGLRVVTEDGETMDAEEVRGKIFRIIDPDEPSGYVVKSMETTGGSTTLSYLQSAG